jgi:opacity protein-like surface antigen
MKKALILVIIVLLSLPIAASANIFTFRYGYFVPRFGGGPNSLWNIEFENMSLKKSDYQSGMIGLAYEYFLNSKLSLVFSVDFYSRDKAGFYRDWSSFPVNNQNFAFPTQYYTGGDMIIHSFEVSQTPIQISLKVTPLGRRVRFVPYFGGGAGIYFWSVRLHGDMIDFSDPYVYSDPNLGDVTVYPINYVMSDESNRISIGYSAFAGIMIPLGNRMTLDVGGRYQFFKVNFRDAFQGFEKFDLSGYCLSLGLNYWF